MALSQNLADMNMRQLLELQMAFGVQADNLRTQREYLSQYIAKRRAAGESDQSENTENVVNAIVPGVIVTSEGAANG